MTRRDALTTAGSLAALSAFTALAEGAGKDTKDTKAPAKAPAADANAAVLASAEACVQAGEDCLELCLKVLSKGDTGMNDCLATVRQMLPLCETLATYARMGSPHLKALAAVCAKVCRDCEATCKKHAQHHAECKKCMETCATCASECEKLG